MRTSIIIKGSGIRSKSTLRRACINHDAHPMTEDELVFDTKFRAVLALSEAYRYLSSDKEDWKNSSGSYQRGFVLHYDAAYAKIEPSKY